MGWTCARGIRVREGPTSGLWNPETGPARLSDESPAATKPLSRRRWRVYTRAVPLVVVASGAFISGIVVAAGPDAPFAQRFLDAWEDGDYAAMRAELTPAARSEYPLEAFEKAYDKANDTATVSSLTIGEADESDDTVVAPLQLETRAFGTLDEDAELPISDAGVAWAPHLAFPGLEDTERLTRRTRAPRRAAILAVDRSALAKGPAAARELEASTLAVVGEVGTPSGDQAEQLTAAGFPPGALTGTSGLELAFNDRLSGRPGGQLVAVSPKQESEVGGGRILAQAAPVPGKAVRTTIDPELQSVAVSALGSLYGGVAVLDAGTGEVRALAGLGYSAPQPPGSTFKVITTSGALDAGIVKTSDSFPVEVSNTDIGREIANASDSPCGGTFTQTFAESCNTVFAPLGVELGGEKLIETAELFGFNSPPTLFGERATAAVNPPASTIPETLDSSVEVGESAIGQGRVLATPLQMASVAQTIANRGVRSPTSIVGTKSLGPELEEVEVATPQTAKTITDLMIEVVNSGTGTAAALPGVQVAGKSGTAELGPKALEPGQELDVGEEPEQELDAWFTAFAPADSPELAVAVMIVNSTGDGGVVAAPIAAEILQAGLE